MGFEAYKLLVSQKGILLLFVLAVVFIKQADFTDVIESGVQEMYCSFIERYEGVPADASEQELGELGSFLDKDAKHPKEMYKITMKEGNKPSIIKRNRLDFQKFFIIVCCLFNIPFRKSIRCLKNTNLVH